MSAPDARVRVDLGLPLPIDVASTIGNLIDAAYPGTVIDTTAGYGVMRLLLPEHRGRAKKVNRRAVAAAVVEPSELPLEVTGWQPTEGGVQASFSAPEQLVCAMLRLVKSVLDGTDGAVNYVEQEVVDREAPYNRYVVIAARSSGQTPHALRQAAEARLAAVLALHFEHASDVCCDPASNSDTCEYRRVCHECGQDWPCDTARVAAR